MGSSRGIRVTCAGCTGRYELEDFDWRYAHAWLCSACRAQTNNVVSLKLWRPRKKKNQKQKSGTHQSERGRKVRAIVRRDGEGCQLCGCRELLTIDHIKPRSAGGTDQIPNLRLLCQPCHVTRHQQEARIAQKQARAARQAV